METTMARPEGLKVDVQSTGIKMNPYIQKKVDGMVKTLTQFVPQIEKVEVQFQEIEGKVQDQRSVTVRLDVPGFRMESTDSEVRWKIAIRNVEKKLLRQLERRKQAIERETAERAL